MKKFKKRFVKASAELIRETDDEIVLRDDDGAQLRVVKRPYGYRIRRSMNEVENGEFAWDISKQIYDTPEEAKQAALNGTATFSFKGRKYSSPIGDANASIKSVSKSKAIKASEDSDDIVMYWDGQKVYEGPIMRDFVDKVNWFLDDPEKLQEIVDYCNSFGDPLIEDTSDTFDVASTFAEVVGWEQGEAEAIDDDFYVSDEAGHFEIFPKSREVQGSVQRRAKKSVNASNNKRGGNAMKLQKRKSITCAGDDYKVKMLRGFLDKMNLNDDNWAYVQVTCNGKAINLDEGAVNLLIDYYTNTYDPKKDAYSSEFVGASRKPAPRRTSVKASTYGDAFEDIERGKDAYIQRWSEEYEGAPATSWDNIFDNVLEEFTRYADDEVSGFILEKFENGEYTAEDMDNEFEQYIMWLDLNEYDQDYYA